MLLRRAYGVDVIASALFAKVEGLGQSRIAERLGAPASTVRNWTRRFASRCEDIRAAATARAYALNPGLGRIDPQASGAGDALEALGAAASAAVALLGTPANVLAPHLGAHGRPAARPRLRLTLPQTAEPVSSPHTTAASARAAISSIPGRFRSKGTERRKCLINYWQSEALAPWGPSSFWMAGEALQRCRAGPKRPLQLQAS